MAAKAFVVLCATALFAQGAVSQFHGRMAPGLGPLRPDIAFDGLGYDGLAYGPAWNTGRLGYGAIPAADIAFDGLAYDGLAYGPAWNTGRLGCGAIPAADIAAASSLNAAYGGGLPVASASPAAPTGLAVASENAYEGAVAVAGNLPFLGTVSMAGEFPTIGAGAVSYGCGDGAVGIIAEGPIAGPAAIGPMAPMAAMSTAAAIGPYGAPFGYPARTCGCGATYI